MATVADLESNKTPSVKSLRSLGRENAEVKTEEKESQGRWLQWTRTLDKLGQRGDVEFGGCTPVPYEQRQETNYFNIFTLWFSMSCNPLP